jgi:hypothetical protein
MAGLLITLPSVATGTSGYLRRPIAPKGIGNSGTDSRREYDSTEQMRFFVNWTVDILGE